MIINGTSQSQEIRDNLKNFIDSHNIIPKLAIIQIGDNKASGIYIRYKQMRASEIGIETEHLHFDDNASTNDIINAIEKLNEDKVVNGIIVQMPLPSHIEKERIVASILPSKDVDGFHPENFGKLNLGMDCLASCTPMGCMNLIKSITPDISGMNAVIIGRSIIVGRPMATMLLNHNASVSILHSHSKDITSYLENADIVIACAGKAGLVKKGMVKKDAIIIDVGVNRCDDGKIIGDCDFDELKDDVKAITPPIGGVGPMTIAMLLYNTIKAYSNQNNIDDFKTECGTFL